MSPRRLAVVFAVSMLATQGGCKEEDFEQGFLLGGNRVHEYHEWDCNERKIFGPFMINTFLDSDKNSTASIFYSIQRNQVSPRYVGMPPAPAFIHINLYSGAGEKGWNHVILGFLNMDALFDNDFSTELPFVIHEMTMQCGRSVTMVGNTAYQPFPLHGAFTRDSPSARECAEALRQGGSFSLRFNDPAKHKNYVQVEGRADFRGAIREAEYMSGQGFERAKLGQCQLSPPHGPIIER